VLPLTKEAAIMLMTAAELRRLLTCNGVAGIKDIPRMELERLAHGLPASDIANAARDAVKRRYRPSHAAFVKHRQGVGTVVAMQTLRRFAKRSRDAVIEPSTLVLPEIELAHDHPLLYQAPAGAVLKRLVS
jgi:hypothetical protein